MEHRYPDKPQKLDVLEHIKCCSYYNKETQSSILLDLGDRVQVLKRKRFEIKDGGQMSKVVVQDGPNKGEQFWLREQEAFLNFRNVTGEQIDDWLLKKGE